MKLRRAVLKQDLRDMPIDHGDMFLMSQVEDLIDAAEVVEVAPWEAAETRERLGSLVKLGLLEWVNERGEAMSPAHSRGASDALDGSVGENDEAEEITRELPRPADAHLAVTLRPKAPLPVADLFRQTEHSVIALRTGDGLVLLDQAVIHRDRSVFSRATIVDEDAPARSRQREPSDRKG